MRKLIVALTFGALLLPRQALTLGLGDIEVNSGLNQQLEAEITLLSATENDKESLIVKLASREEFQRAGLDRPFMLSSLKFTTESRDGVPFVKVVSPKPIREPFLNFLIEVDWPQGHLIREYTILLDPPIFSGKPAPEPSSISSRPAMSDESAGNNQADGFRATSPVTQTTSTGTTLSGVNSAGSSESTQNQRLPASADGYRIQTGDTAWSLAESLRPDTSVSVEKMMLALLRTNPEAFINENVNGLKRGYVLRVPDVSEINSINQAQALSLVREQNALWREYQQAMANGTPVPGHDSGMKSDGTMSTGVDEGRLAIVGVDGGTSAGTDPTAMSTDELRSELALTSEQLETERLEKENLKNQVDKLQGQIDNMKGLIDVEDTEMAEMQSNVSPDEATTAPVEELVAKVQASEQPTVEKIEAPKEVTPQALEQTAKPKAVAPPPMTPAPVAESGLFDDPMILMAGGAGLLILLALVALIIKRRKASSDDDNEEDATESEEAVAEETGVVNSVEELDDDATQIADEEDSEEESHDATVILQAAPSHEETVITEAQTVVTEAISPATPEPIEEETDDVMAEADVYLAYGIFQQAEELLQAAIESNPDREMYRVKLCETFYAAKNADAFETAAKALLEQTGGEDTAGWLKVAALGKDLCPDSDTFKNVDVAAAVDAVITDPSAAAEMDIDLGGDENAAEATDLDLDFDAVDEPLELSGLDETDESPTEEATDVPDEPLEEVELEFDIGETDAIEEAVSEEEFSLDIDASELDISATETTDDTANESADDNFVDDSLDFGIDEIESAETADDADTELDIEASSSALDDATTDEADISMDLGDDLGIDMDLDTTDAGTDDALDISMDVDEGDVLDSLSEDSSEDVLMDDGAIDIGIDLDEGASDESAEDASTIEEDDKTVMRSPDDLGLPALDDVDEISTKLDLARAYMDMGDHEGSRSILDEVVAEGNDEQKQEAGDLLKELDS